MFQWVPEPGTLPGRTEVRVLDAVSALQRLGAKEVPYLAVYGYVSERGWPPVDDGARVEEWQAREWLKDRFNWDWSFADECFIDDHGNRYSVSRALAEARWLGFRAAWRPSEGTIRKRLDDLRARGYVEKTRPGHWVLTDAGRELSRRLADWEVAP